MSDSSSQLQAVEIEINHNCNRACTYCPNSITERKTKGRMTEEVFVKVISELKDFGFSGRLSFHFYGEPLLHPNLSDFVRKAKVRLPRSPIHIYSNGSLLTKEKFEELESSGVDLFIVTRHEADLQDADYEFESVFTSLEAGQKEKVDYRDFRRLIFVNRGGMIPKLGDPIESFLPCHLPSHVLNITVDGRVLACLEDFNEEQIFGSIMTKSLYEIWQSESYQLFRKRLKQGFRHMHKPCNSCNRREALPPFF